MSAIIIIGVLAVALGLSIYASPAKFDSDDAGEDKEDKY